MWKAKKSEQRAESSEQRAAGRTRPRRRTSAYCLLLTAYCSLSAGCRMDMQDTPRYEVYEPSRFGAFSDGLSSRPYVEGTVPRGYLREDKFYYQGKAGGAQGGAQALSSGGQTSEVLQNGVPNAQAAAAGTTQPGGGVNVRGNAGGNVGLRAGETQGTSGGVVNEFPFPVTMQVLGRGRDRYQVFCAMCHGDTGFGDGMIVRRGFRRPPSYHDDRLRQAALGHFYDVITNGWGAMPDYASMIPPEDRWAIIAYVRALQYSQNADPAQVPPEIRSRTAPPAGGGGPRPASQHQGTGGEREQ